MSVEFEGEGNYDMFQLRESIHDLIVFSQSEDKQTDKDGNWSIATAKGRLHNFVQQRKLPPLNFTYEVEGPVNDRLVGIN